MAERKWYSNPLVRAGAAATLALAITSPARAQEDNITSIQRCAVGTSCGFPGMPPGADRYRIIEASNPDAGFALRVHGSKPNGQGLDPDAYVIIDENGNGIPEPTDQIVRGEQLRAYSHFEYGQDVWVKAGTDYNMYVTVARTSDRVVFELQHAEGPALPVREAEQANTATPTTEIAIATPRPDHLPDGRPIPARLPDTGESQPWQHPDHAVTLALAGVLGAVGLTFRRISRTQAGQ